MSMNRFGRLVAPQDARDLNYLMRSARAQIIDLAAKPKPRKRAYRDGPLLDQGYTNECVGYSCRGFLDCAPIMSKPHEGPSASRIYRDAQDRDEWPGNNYEGSSVRGGMKAMADAGQISSYIWGQSIEEAIRWMNEGYGTAIFGTNWYPEMSSVDNNGFMLEPASNLSTPIGGHAYRLIWYDAKKKGILVRNSWGPDFGILKRGVGTGYAYMTVKLAERLLHEHGEIASATQIKIKPVSII